MISPRLKRLHTLHTDDISPRRFYVYPRRSPSILADGDVSPIHNLLCIRVNIISDV